MQLFGKINNVMDVRYVKAKNGSLYKGQNFYVNFSQPQALRPLRLKILLKRFHSLTVKMCKTEITTRLVRNYLLYYHKILKSCYLK